MKVTANIPMVGNDKTKLLIDGKQPEFFKGCKGFNINCKPDEITSITFEVIPEFIDLTIKDPIMHIKLNGKKYRLIEMEE